jgi:hypothetical protein
MGKDAIGTGCVVLRVGFPNPLAIGSFQRLIFVGVQTGVARIELEQTQALHDLFEEPLA